MGNDDTLEEPETVFEQARGLHNDDPFHDDDTIHAGLHNDDPFHDDDTIHAGLHDDDTIDVDPELLQQTLAQARRGTSAGRRRPLLWATAVAATALAAGLVLGWWAAGGPELGAAGGPELGATCDDGYLPVWSPDGTKIAYAGWDDDTRCGVFVVDVDGANNQRLTITYPSVYDLDWSPDGTRIAYEWPGGLSVIDADGSGHRRLSLNPPVR
ncbi:MAG: hypothetical protein OXC00_04235 [Acidimicrobiaceae bacterium]|nr:hypothetical protein [Acidimicrobiaceae bacterium]